MYQIRQISNSKRPKQKFDIVTDVSYIDINKPVTPLLSMRISGGYFFCLQRGLLLLYHKPPLTIDGQISHLVSRGLIIRNREFARQTLSEINYYRLSAYFLPFQKDTKQHIFYPKTTFEKVVKLYQFDKALRNIIMPAVESAEVLARMRLTYHLSIKYKDPFCYLKPDLYSNKFLGKQVAREDLRFIQNDLVEEVWNSLIDNGYINKKGNVEERDINKDLFTQLSENNFLSLLRFFKYLPMMNG